MTNPESTTPSMEDPGYRTELLERAALLGISVHPMAKNETIAAKIAAKLRELASLFDLAEEEPKAKAVEQEEPKAVEQEEPKAKAVEQEEPKPKVTKPAKQMEIEAFTLDHIRQAMAKLIGAGKREQALAILAELGVKKVSEITEDQFSRTMELVNEAR